MYILAPSLLAADFNRLGEQISETQRCGAKYLHIDVMDGIFVPSISFGMPLIQSIRPTSKQFFDVHLMIVEPERYIKEFAACGADGITFHLEATQDPQKVIDLIHSYGLEAGISIKPGTELEEVFPYLSQVEMVLLMSVEPGFGGQAYLPESTERIARLRQYITENHLHTKLEVDGGIDADHVEEAMDAGAEILVAGSAVFRKAPIAENIEKFMKIFQSREAV